MAEKTKESGKTAGKPSEADKQTETEKKLPAKKGGLKKLIIVAAALVVIGATGAYFMSKWSHKTENKGENADSKRGKEGTAEGKKKTGMGDATLISMGDLASVVVVKPIVVNLADSEGTRYIRIGLNIGSNDKKLTEEYEKNPIIQSLIQDTLIQVLSAKTSKDLLSPNGKADLKRELKETLNSKLESKPVVGVFFTEFLVQL